MKGMGMRQVFSSVGLVVLVVVWPAVALAQAPDDPQALRQELVRLRQEVDALQQQYGERLSALEARLAAVEAKQTAGAAPTPIVSTAPTGAAAPASLAAAPSGGDQPAAAQLPVYGPATSKVLNPDVGIIGNLIAASGESKGGTESLAPFPFVTLQESEASFQAIVDPFARADFFLAIGEESIEVEEGFVTFPTVPGGLLLKAGKMRANFGRLNAFHNHTLPWIDRPLVMFNLLGGATEDPDTGIKDAGLSVSRLIPAGNLFVEATAELYRGESENLFEPSRRRDFSVVGRLRSYADLNEETNLEIGVSYARGHNEFGKDFLTQLYGTDLTLRWKPLRRARYESFVARGEFIWSRRDQPDKDQAAFGGFVSADYQLARRWFSGLRVDWAERSRRADLRDRGWSGILTFWPSEFSQIRGQYRRTRYAEGPTANELLFQVLFTIGAHGAHAF